MSKEKTYESAQTELNVILEKMQSKDISLDESIKLYKEASELIKFMRDKLDEATEEIEALNIENK